MKLIFLARSFYVKSDEFARTKCIQQMKFRAGLQIYVLVSIFLSSTDSFVTAKLPTSEGTISSEQQVLSIVAPYQWLHFLK